MGVRRRFGYVGSNVPDSGKGPGSGMKRRPCVLVEVVGQELRFTRGPCCGEASPLAIWISCGGFYSIAVLPEGGIRCDSGPAACYFYSRRVWGTNTAIIAGGTGLVSTPGMTPWFWGVSGRPRQSTRDNRGAGLSLGWRRAASRKTMMFLGVFIRPDRVKI